VTPPERPEPMRGDMIPDDDEAACFWASRSTEWRRWAEHLEGENAAAVEALCIANDLIRQLNVRIAELEAEKASRWKVYRATVSALDDRIDELEAERMREGGGGLMKRPVPPGPPCSGTGWLCGYVVVNGHALSCGEVKRLGQCPTEVV
jgi:hypothetical protein